MTEWRDIADAPKCFPPAILIHEPDAALEYRVQMGFWDNATKSWVSCDATGGFRRPTHWMPLPEPPK